MNRLRGPFAIAIAFTLMCVVVFAVFDPPRGCDKCGGNLSPHARNSDVLECKKCGFMVYTRHWQQKGHWGSFVGK